jgi:hypothetical protein
MAVTSQKQSDRFLSQVSARLHERMTMARAKRVTDPFYEWESLYVNANEHSQANNQTIDASNGREADFPSKILCFFIDPVSREIRALIHTCHERQSDDYYAPICDEWFLEYEEFTRTFVDHTDPEFADGRRRRQRLLFPIIRDVSVDTCGDPIFVVQETPGIQESFDLRTVSKSCNRCIVIKNREANWSKEFC